MEQSWRQPVATSRIGRAVPGPVRRLRNTRGQRMGKSWTNEEAERVVERGNTVLPDSVRPGHRPRALPDETTHIAVLQLFLRPIRDSNPCRRRERAESTPSFAGIFGPPERHGQILVKTAAYLAWRNRRSTALAAAPTAPASPALPRPICAARGRSRRLPARVHGAGIAPDRAAARPRLCAALLAVNGACGSANGVAVNSAPTAAIVPMPAPPRRSPVPARGHGTAAAPAAAPRRPVRLLRRRSKSPAPAPSCSTVPIIRVSPTIMSPRRATTPITGPVRTHHGEPFNTPTIRYQRGGRRRRRRRSSRCPAARPRRPRRRVRAARVLIISGNWVTSGLLPG